jgi:hypothetical protein
MIRQSCSGGSRPRVLRDVIRGIRTEGPPGSGPQGPEPSGGPCPKIGRRFPGPDLPPGSPRVPGSPGPRVRTEGPPGPDRRSPPGSGPKVSRVKCSGPRVSNVPDRGSPGSSEIGRIPTEVVPRDPDRRSEDPPGSRPRLFGGIPGRIHRIPTEVVQDPRIPQDAGSRPRRRIPTEVVPEIRTEGRDDPDRRSR